MPRSGGHNLKSQATGAHWLYIREPSTVGFAHRQISFLLVLTFSRPTLSAACVYLHKSPGCLYRLSASTVSVSALTAQAPQAASPFQKVGVLMARLQLTANSSTPAVC